MNAHSHIFVIETERLLLTPLELTDAPVIQRQFPRWEIVKFMAAHIPWPYPEDGAITFVRDLALPAMRAGTEWHWSIRPRRQPADLIGVISLMDKPDDNRGFWLSSEWQGQGLMTEASAAVTDFWFDVLGREVLRVPKAVQNSASRRLSARTGMRVIWTGERDYGRALGDHGRRVAVSTSDLGPVSTLSGRKERPLLGKCPQFRIAGLCAACSPGRAPGRPAWPRPCP
jgi:[ribosomal protein S5]-alanine N-acetyltransferase